MENFREFLNQQPAEQEAWRMGKKDIIRHWSALPPGMPISQMRTIPKDYKGKSFYFDGLRITGSAQYINSILSRIKDILHYEGQGRRLQVVYRQQVDKRNGQGIPDSYVFYLQVRQASE